VDPNLVIAPSVSPDVSPPVAKLIQDRELHLQALRHHLGVAHNKMKLQVDKKRVHLEFQVGDKVLLKLQPYVQTSVANIPYPKLSFKYYGPYEVVQRIGSVAYKLQLHEDSHIHPVFHISQLKPFYADYTPVYFELPKMTDLTATPVSPRSYS
jgi:hypothetical protein